MAFAVKRTYACPICGESFTKWSLCQSHLNGSAPCRVGLGDKVYDLEQLQDLCRAAAAKLNAVHKEGFAAPPAPETIVSSTAVSSSLSAAAVPFVPTVETHPSRPSNGTSTDTMPAAHTAYHSFANGAAIAKPLFSDEKPPPPPPLSDMTMSTLEPAQLCRCVHAKLDLAVQHGYLLEVERRQLDDFLQTLKEHSPTVQTAAVTKFLSPNFVDFRWIKDKALWLQMCLKFVTKTNSSARTIPDLSKPSAKLLAALASHALLPNSLAPECWTTFDMLPSQLQTNVVKAVQHSVVMGFCNRPSEHFAHLCVNEEAIYNLEAKPLPYIPIPAPLELEAIDGTLYQRLLQQMLFKRRNAEERLLQMLAEDSALESGVQPGEPGSLIYVHRATDAARRHGSAEVSSLLHAAAACGLDRICARFIAEGLDVNERAGHQEFTPLHLAASNGAISVVEMLLRQGADPTIQDNTGHSALYHGVTAVPVETDMGAVKKDAPAHWKLQLKLCQLLLMGILKAEKDGIPWNDPEDKELEFLAASEGLWQLRNMLRMHARLRELQRRLPSLLSDAALAEFCKLQYETACFLMAIFERHLTVSEEAACVEFRAVLASDFIQARNHVQRLGNRLNERLGISKRSTDMLMNLPPQAAIRALESWTLEEVVEGVYETKGPPLERSEPSDAEHHSGADKDGVKTIEDAAEVAAKEAEDLPNLLEDPNRATGMVRKWDSERGYGFIVQDEPDAEDLFVHRTNLKGCLPGCNIDLREGSRISYLTGIQDNKPRAMQAAMIDAEGRMLIDHLVTKTSASDKAEKDKQSKKKMSMQDLIDEEEDDMSRKLMQHIASSAVQENAKEKRVECEAWLRCVGLRRHNTGRRDDSLWKKEIERRIDLFLEELSTPLQKKDFDFKVRRCLTEFCMHSTVARVSEALAMLGKSTSGKSRDDVRSWPAYLATLLRHYDPGAYASMTDRDRKSRIEQRKKKQEDADDNQDDGDGFDSLPPLGAAKVVFSDEEVDGSSDSMSGGEENLASLPKTSGGAKGGASFAFQ
eukprot:TRINITY_DN20764_c0_g1_i1.p1 TRINITY_DN20764_c0_g1~~TRINITY_DN20764_c0_g1_i1.p1  ORF type:complete len:1035 (-),score=259.30 TRINITY_DN20764_c0_g1_i1:187-3291(-)